MFGYITLAHHLKTFRFSTFVLRQLVKERYKRNPHVQRNIAEVQLASIQTHYPLACQLTNS